MNMRLDNGVIAACQQRHFSPDCFRNCTVIGTEGRLENFGDRPGDEVRVWNTGPTGYRTDADVVHRVPERAGLARRGGRPDRRRVLPLRAGGRRHRHLPGGGPHERRRGRDGDPLPARPGRTYEVPPRDPALLAYLTNGQGGAGSGPLR